jgi:type II secretory pathway pseudopilin PulG
MKNGCMTDSRGFSLIEVLLGISVFMIGMLGVTALNISSLKSNTYSGNLSEATLIGATKLEEIMAMDFDDIADTDLDGTGKDLPPPDGNDDGVDDSGNNFGLDDIGVAADWSESDLGKNNNYTVYWNVADSEPLTVTPSRTKTVNVIVEWSIKGQPRRVSMSMVRMKEE